MTWDIEDLEEVDLSDLYDILCGKSEDECGLILNYFTNPLHATFISMEDLYNFIKTFNERGIY